MNRLLLALSVFVLLASLVIHLLTFFAVPPLSPPLMFLMQFVVIALGFAGLYAARHEYPERRSLSLSPGRIISQYREIRQAEVSLLRPVPLWARVLFYLVFAYFGFNFALAANQPVASDFSSLKADTGKYYLVKKSGSMTELTRGEYEARRRQEARLFSDGWLVVSLSAVLFFAFIAPTLERKEKRKE